MNPFGERRPALDARALGRAYRVVWSACVVVYLTVFIGALQAGVSDLNAMARAIGLTLATALLGRLTIGLVSRANLPLDEGRTTDRDGQVGSRLDRTELTNVAQRQDEAEAA